MSYKEIYELSNELYAERLELVEERIEQILSLIHISEPTRP